MANKIRIKRKKLGDSANAPLADNNSFKWGEIAYNETGDILYYGGGSGDLNQDNASRILPIAGSGQYVLRDGSNATGIWNISVSAATNAVYTTGNQTISGVKTFSNRPIFNSGLAVSGVDASSNSGLFLPVFTGNPSSSQQTLFTRTPSQFKSDIGLGNVDNISLTGYSRNGIDSRSSFPPDTHNITSHTGTNWQIFYTNDANAVVGLALGSNGQVLKSNGTTSAPTWQADNDTVYTHPTQTAISELPANGKVLSAIGVNTLGHVTGVGTKTLAEADIPPLAQSKITNLTTDLSNKLSLSGGTMTGSLTLNSDPTNTLHAATKGYVDAVKQGLDIKDSVKVATNQSLGQFYYSPTDSSLYGSSAVALPDIDGITLSINDRILVKNETATEAKYNGIYRVHFLGEDGEDPWVLARSNDAKMSEQVTAGMFTFVEEGNTNGDSGWVLTTNDPISLNSTGLTFAQFSAAGQIYDGSGLYKSGNTIHVGQGDGISVLDNSVAVNSTVLRTSGVQTITGDKDFGNNFLIKPAHNASSAFFPAFAVEPSEFSQRLTYMTKSELVTALSFETPELGNSFVNTTGNQTISGVKTFANRTYFNAPDFGAGSVGNIILNNDTSNCIYFNGSGLSDVPQTNENRVLGTKIVLKPSIQSDYPASIGIGVNKIWNTSPSTFYTYEWYAGPSKIASLSGNGTFETTTLKSTNLYINNIQVNATATELNLLASAIDKHILIGNGTDFIKQNFITALSGAIISQSGLTISNNASNLIINHNLSSATSTSNSNPNVVQNILIDDYGHITGVSNLNLDDIYLTSSDLNTQISFVSGIGSYYDTSNSGLTVFHSGGNKPADTYGGNGIKSIQLDSYGHIYDISTETYVASGNLCSAISDCTIDGGTY